MTDTDYSAAIAVIGMSGRFPGADSIGELWQNLLTGVKGLREITEEELSEAGVPAEQLSDPRYVRVGGPLPQVDQFDAAVFGFNPREAETMEPQHRMFLECSWEALESAGYCPTDAPGHVGVFGGCGFPHYMIQNVRQVANEPGGDLLLGIGNERDSLTNLVSYKLGLRGPSIAVQSFCSTSLVAVHLACQSLLTYECDIALAGGAFIPLPQPVGYLYEQGGIVSPDGVVRSFDAAASGTVMGSGVGTVALKRMSEALADGDVIHAVILGSTTNNDGRVRAGYTAPGVDGQAEVIETALRVAGVKPDTIGYLECHATGTVLGDSIELAAMNRVFQQTPEMPCVLGSLKPSIGHLDRASGVAGLMRAALSLEHELLPATPNYESPNTALVGASERFTVLTEHRPWPRGTHPRRAGVSSFGLGGTNAHVVLEQAPAREVQPVRPGPHLLMFSAADSGALAELTTRLRQHLIDNAGLDLADVAYTLQVSRGGFALRRGVVCQDQADAIAALAEPARWIDGETRRRNPLIRLAAAEGDVPAQWWSQLQSAVSALLPGTGAATAEPTPASALTALGDGLTKVGIRLASGGEQGTVIDVLVQPQDSDSAASWLLGALARLWQEGCVIDWPALHGGLGRRVELPTYPFQRRRFWVKADQSLPAAPVSTGRAADRAHWTYLPTWAQRPLPTTDLDEQLRVAGPWLMLTDDPRGEALVARLQQGGAEVTAVRPGAAFDQDDAGDFTIRSDEPADLAELLRSMLVLPRTIVHGFSLASPEAGPDDDPIAHFGAEQERGFYSALALCRELVDDTGAAPPIELVLLTSGATAVLNSDLRHPEHATLAALGPSLSQENPRLHCRHIDIDPASAEDAVALDRLTGATLAAVLCAHQGPVAVRAGESWLRSYEQLPLDPPAEKRLPVGQGDTVLITGGLGDVGLTLARHLSSRYGCRLVLTARSPLPPREQWQAFLDAVPTGGERTARHLTNILDLEARGATVLAMSADVADLDQMRAVVEASVERFGSIDVVVHGAGVQNDEFFNFAHLMDRRSCQAHLTAKVHGFLVLQAVLGGHAPDRRITLSSLAAVLGGMTLSAYAAANAGLDAYLRAARFANAGRWITVDWDTWNVDAERLDSHGPTVQDFAMAPSEAVDIFERTLAAAGRVGHLVISTGSLDARLAQWVTGDISAGAEVSDDDARERHPRPNLAVMFAPPAPGTQQTLAEIWSAALGVEPIGADDNFFELGGHSLVAIKLTTRIRKSLQTSIPVTALLEFPTVRQLADLIDEGPQD